MSTAPRILALAGSTRRDSFNHRLVTNAAAAARAVGAEVTVIRLSDYPLPLFDEDLEAAQGAPPAARELKRLMSAQDGFLIAAPEYNSSITAVLKNAIDWVSRPAPPEPPLVAFRGKVAGLLSASPGTLGGLRGLVHVRAILGNLGVLVLPDQIAVARAHEAFTPDGALKDPQQQAAVEELGRRVAQVAARLKA